MTSYDRTHWGPYNPAGETCRFCERPPYPYIRNSQDAVDYARCFDARLPPLWLRLSGLLSVLERAGRS